jgi:hypothetical protein
MENKHENEGEKQKPLSSLHGSQDHQDISNIEKLRDQELEKILIELGGKLEYLFCDINPENLISNAMIDNSDTELKATISLLKVALSTFIEDCKKINTITKIYQKMNEKEK